MQTRHKQSWDIFCSVVDNYGDIGVCWRLARQLAGEYGLKVRLWVDKLESLQKICPEILYPCASQACLGVEVRLWSVPFPEVIPADVVIEAFACALPASYEMAMAEKTSKPVWINLEYLTAENWVDDCHGLASPHPRLPLVKYFFFPGFTSSTGGLLREKILMAERDAFQQSEEAQVQFWQSLAVSPRPSYELKNEPRVELKDEIRISLFCYPDNQVFSLLSVWAAGNYPVLCCVPEGVASAALARFFGQLDVLEGAPKVGESRRKGALEVRILPFLSQDQYDRLLWACDCNFVRGEDSFVRAQWAARPFVWQIYPQDENTHHLKLDAFLDLYCLDWVESGSLKTAENLSCLWKNWNAEGHKDTEELGWASFWAHREALGKQAVKWGQQRLENGDLTANLVTFCGDKL